MRERQPELPKKMTGGLRNPLGAKALYLGNSLYRIHGTNDAMTIGQAASSGCFRMMNEHVMHLASLVEIGTVVKVVRRWPGERQVRQGSLAVALTVNLDTDRQQDNRYGPQSPIDPRVVAD